MPDNTSTEGISALLVKDGDGDITSLSPKGGKFRHVPFMRPNRGLPVPSGQPFHRPLVLIILEGSRG
jgi:hypothetical protein